MNSIGTRMGWDNERYPRTKKDTLDLSFISFEISHSSPGFLILGLDDIFPCFGIPHWQGYPKNLKRYPWDIQHLVISLAYP
jgi:hypothetical protein